MPDTDLPESSSSVTIPGWMVRPVLIAAVLAVPTALAWFVRLELRNSAMDVRVSSLEAAEAARVVEGAKTREDISGIKTDVAVIRTVLENLQADRRATRESVPAR